MHATVDPSSSGTRSFVRAQSIADCQSFVPALPEVEKKTGSLSSTSNVGLPLAGPFLMNHYCYYLYLRLAVTCLPSIAITAFNVSQFNHVDSPLFVVQRTGNLPPTCIDSVIPLFRTANRICTCPRLPRLLSVLKIRVHSQRSNTSSSEGELCPFVHRFMQVLQIVVLVR